MKRRESGRAIGLLLLAVVIALTGLSWPATAASSEIAARWVQYTADGAEARIVTSGPCPALLIDGRPLPMDERAAPDTSLDAKFPMRVCAGKIPTGAGRASVLGATLPAPEVAPARIIVLGDSGCRLQGGTMQACNDPAAWPWARIAAAAAALHPDLVIHVGDYLYRESPCPKGAPRCAGSPWGDNWPSWQADFFAPAAPLLSAAPWVIVRGNHEECARAGRGWTRLLGPGSFDPAAPCAENLPPYAVLLKGLALIVLDDANAPDVPGESSLVPLYRANFERVAELAREPSWLLMHRPIRGVVRVGPGLVIGGNQTMLPALASGLPPAVELLLSGHFHIFEAMNYDKGSPPQLVVGTGGDNLNEAPADLTGIEVGGARVTEGLAVPGFGFLMLSRVGAGWNAEVYDVAGKLRRRCAMADRHITCEAG